MKELEFASLRERILEVLKSSNEPLTVNDIIAILDLEPSRRSEVYEHLMHIAKTIRAKSHGQEQLVMIPPKCKNCGYIFTSLKKAKKPNRCPKCKSERISPPAFMIIRK
ncbi:MAG: transcriptional regulator [Candidatus Methanomethylicota archaeon]|uniref:Transcriptional regulator n=1 Tax=Thermoproteota archaeon TaxID=2056631 RepID=A0A497F4J8_9CREN|nr:MAG: transcriptional regulator [Candidatus Verstraetearchaeota archaeon]